jgi:hypothetical protein
MQAHNPMQESSMAKKRPTAIAGKTADEMMVAVGLLAPPATAAAEGFIGGHITDSSWVAGIMIEPRDISKPMIMENVALTLAPPTPPTEPTEHGHFAEAPIAFGPSLIVCDPGTINAPDGAELVGWWKEPDGRKVEVRKYAIDDWRVYDSHQEHPTQHQNMPAAFGQLVRAFHFRARSWWTERAT